MRLHQGRRPHGRLHEDRRQLSSARRPPVRLYESCRHHVRLASRGMQHVRLHQCRRHRRYAASRPPGLLQHHGALQLTAVCVPGLVTPQVVSRPVKQPWGLVPLSSSSRPVKHPRAWPLGQATASRRASCLHDPRGGTPSGPAPSEADDQEASTHPASYTSSSSIHTSPLAATLYRVEAQSWVIICSANIQVATNG